MKSPVRYDTGWKRLDNFLSAVAYAVVLVALMALAGAVSFLFWAHWRMYG